MSAHVSFVAEALDLNCYYGECERDHDPDVDCPPTPVVACVKCTDDAEEDPEGLRPIIVWPCAFVQEPDGSES